MEIDFSRRCLVPVHQCLPPHCSCFAKKSEMHFYDSDGSICIVSVMKTLGNGAFAVNTNIPTALNINIRVPWAGLVCQ